MCVSVLFFLYDEEIENLLSEMKTSVMINIRKEFDGRHVKCCRGCSLELGEKRTCSG